MSSTLSEGVRVPDIGSVNWGADVNFNWGLLNTCLANISSNVKVDAENTWTAPQTFTETISGSIDGVAARAVGDEDGNNIKAAIASKAADNAVVHLAGAETITGDKTWTGANTFHSITPETDNTYSLGNSSYQWASVYAQTYYYNGTAWGLDKANVWSQNQTFPGITILNTSWSGVTPPSSAKATIIEFKNSDTRQGRYINRIGVNSAETWIETIRNVDANTSHNFTVIYSVDNTGNKKLVPYNSDAGLGESISSGTGRWKTLNGINPGALSLPAVATTWLDTTGWVLDGTTENNLPISGSTVTLGYGWLQFRVVHTLGVTSFVRVDTSYRIWTAQDENCLPTYTLWMPVFVGASFRVIVKADSVQVRFHPSLGNV